MKKNSLPGLLLLAETEKVPAPRAREEEEEEVEFDKDEEDTAELVRASSLPSVFPSYDGLSFSSLCEPSTPLCLCLVGKSA
jgi:hypothetical protein